MAKKTAARKKPTGTEAEIVFPSITAELGDVIDGSEDDTTELEQENPAPGASDVGSDEEPQAVAAAAEAVKKAKAKKKEKTEPMAEAVVSKAEMIRNEIGARKAAGEANIRPRDIVAALASRGVKVHAPQVSVAIRDYGKTASKPKNGKLERKRVMAKVSSTSRVKPAATGTEPSYSDLTAVGQFVSGIGGLDKARQVLDAYARLLSPAK